MSFLLVGIMKRLSSLVRARNINRAARSTKLCSVIGKKKKPKKKKKYATAGHGSRRRWMNSGPLAGLSEIELQALQPGSSIMPGKVNPVIPEAVTMVSADVIGNDVSITVAAQAGNFQLNVMLPVIAYNLLKSINLLSGAMDVLSSKAIKTFKVNKKNLEASLSKNPILVTALNPIIGYEKAAEIAKKAYKQGKPIIEVASAETELTEAQLKELLNPSKLTKGGISK